MTKLALVTGCSGGLGAALVTELLSRDFRVIATSRNPDSISLCNARLTKVALDLSQPDSFAVFASHIHENYGNIDLLINNAGYGQMGPVVEIPWRDVQNQLHTNVVAPLALVQAFLPQLIETHGMVVNIGSVSAHLTTPFAGSYCASKSAFHSLNDAMRMELAPFGVSVQCVLAGGIHSNFGINAREQLDKSYPPQSRYHSILNYIRERAELSQKNGSPAEVVARQIVSATLRSPRRPYITAGAGARQLYLLSLFPHRWLDRILSSKFGLSKLAADKV